MRMDRAMLGRILVMQSEDTSAVAELFACMIKEEPSGSALLQTCSAGFGEVNWSNPLCI